MRKLLLSVFALSLGMTTATAQLLTKLESGLIVAKTTTELNGNEFDQNADDNAAENGLSSYWYMPAGTLFYEDADLAVSAAVQSTICPKSWFGGKWDDLNLPTDAYINLGCGGYFPTGQLMPEDSEIWDPAVLVKGNQSTLLIKAKKAGKFTATVHHSKGNRVIGMYLIHTEAEIEATEKPGKFIATAADISMDAEGNKGVPVEWSVDLEAGREYYLIASDNNIAMPMFKYEAVASEEPAVEGLLRKLDSGLIVAKTTTELNGNEFDQNADDNAAENGLSSYWYMPAGTLFYEDADLAVSAAVQSTICPKSWFGGKWDDLNLPTDAYINLGCGGYFPTGQLMPEDSEIWDPAVLVKGNQSTLLIKAKKAGKFTATVHHSKGNRVIGMYLIHTEAEIEATEKPGKFIATAADISMDAEGNKGVPVEWSVDLEAGREYYLIASDNNIAMPVFKYEVGATSIEAVAVESANGKIFSIDGRYVGTAKANLVKGLYIQNGKKFIVK